MTLNLSEVANVMAEKYKESSFRWAIMLKRLERQGYGIYKNPILKSTPDEIDDELEELAYKSFETLEEVKETVTDNLEIICPVYISTDLYCSNCSDKVTPDSRGKIISYKGKIVCYRCALSEVMKWTKEAKNEQ